MPWLEWRNGVCSVKYRKPDGKIKRVSFNERGEHFAGEEEAWAFGLNAEADIRRGKWVDPDAPKITFGEWAPMWYAGLDLEPTTLRNYRTYLRKVLLPAFEHRELESFVPEEMDPWERSLVRGGYAPRTAKDIRDLLINVLGSAVPRHLGFNPAARRRGKGRKGLKRIEAHRRAAKQWATPLEVILLAERAAMLAGDVEVFLMLVTTAFTGLRWCEVLALTPESLLPDGRLDIQWKLYELSGFYWGHPKDGSIRRLHVPPFLLAMLGDQVARARTRTCTCSGRDEELPEIDGMELVEWCTGSACLFLTPQRAHHTRGGFGGRVMRPAADGCYPGRTGARARPARSVIVDVTPPDGAGEIVFPGRPLQPPWPYATPGQEFVIPRRQGHWGYDPGDPDRRHVASWVPLRPGLTPHGLRHGHQTWMDDGGVKKALKTERMGHEDLSMQGLYGHVTEGMVAELVELLQGLWERAVGERFAIHPRSPVPVLDAALAPWREGAADGTVTLLRKQA